MNEEPMSAAGPTTTAQQEPPPSAPIQPMQRMNRHVVGLAVAVLAVAVMALAVLASASHPATRFASGTPEGAFQSYLHAWEANDLDAAYATFSQRVRTGLSVDEYRRTARGYDTGADRGRRVVLLDSQVRGDQATIDLRVDQASGGGLFGAQSVWSRTITVDLVRENGAWRLDQALANLEPVYWSGY